MAKLTINDVTSGYVSTTAINTAFTAIETALENTLSRDGTSPNQMSANLDMNGYAVLNARATTGNANFLWLGTWATGSSYSVNNLVYAPEGTNKGATLICVTAHIAGATLDGDAAKWAVFAQRGASGEGAGDVAGPASSTPDSLAIFSGTTGKLLKDGAVIGTHVQAYDSTLAALAGLTADAGLIEQTGADAFTKTPITAFAKTLLDDADSATARATLGVSKPVIQRRRNTQSAVASTTATIPYDDTIPQITEGGLLFSEPFTPLSADSRIRITTTAQLRADAENIVRAVAVFRAGVADALGVSAAYGDPAAAGGYGFTDVTCTVDIPSPGTSAQTFEVRYGPHGVSTLYVNAESPGDRRYGGAFATFVEIEEYLP